MAYKMTKRGSLDNETTNEFICDKVEDLAQIAPSSINLGSVAIVIEGMQVFIAGSDKQWNSITPVVEENETTSA